MGATRIAPDGSTDDHEIVSLVTAKMAAVLRALEQR
jgi:hypothetical protein